MRLVSPISFVLLVGCLSACADKGGEGMFILNNTAPPIGATCTLTGDPVQPFTAAGEISYLAAAAGAGYIMTPLIESRITATTGNDALRTIHLEGANVTATVANGGASQSYSVLFAGSVAPNGGTTNVAFDVLPVDKMQALGASNANSGMNTVVVTTIAVYGTLGGGQIDAEPFQYPITIIAPGKGIVTGLGTDGTIAGGAISCGSMSLPVASTGNPCNPYQDGVLGCCLSNIGAVHAVCPAVADASVFP
ncbi:MAG: hypothetical protein ABI591_34445 [Kofleriaceae bacterium]